MPLCDDSEDACLACLLLSCLHLCAIIQVIVHKRLDCCVIRRKIIAIKPLTEHSRREASISVLRI